MTLTPIGRATASGAVGGASSPVDSLAVGVGFPAAVVRALVTFGFGFGVGMPVFPVESSVVGRSSIAASLSCPRRECETRTPARTHPSRPPVSCAKPRVPSGHRDRSSPSISPRLDRRAG